MGRAGQGRLGVGRAGQVRAGVGRTGQGRAGQGRAGVGHMSNKTAVTPPVTVRGLRGDSMW